MSSRFKDKNFILHDFMYELHLVCPECKHMMVSINDTDTYKSKLACTKCSFRSSSNNTIIELSIKANCNNCGEKINYLQTVSEKKEFINIRCKACKTNHKFEPKVSEYKTFQVITDKYNLWYEEDFKGNHFWALNNDHLEYIEAYINADLRLRDPKKRPVATMAERLPMFVKSAKNRDALLKLIDKMKKK